MAERRSHALVAFLACSAAVHTAAFATLSSLERGAPAALPKPIELVMFEVQTPPAPPPPPPRQEIPKPKAAPKVAVLKRLPPKKEEVPPPNDPAPESPKKPVPLAVGISMSSTTTAGSFSAPVGNTLAGASPRQAPPPSSVIDYVPLHEVDTQPERISDFVIPYPPELQKRGIEGEVVLRLSIDALGNVTSARVLKGPGFGLNEAAQQAALKLKFKPARKSGQAVATELTYTYRFELL